MMYGDNNGFGNGNGFGPFNPYGVPGTGFQYNGINPQQYTKHNNVLTAEEIASLMKKENQFSLALTESDKLKAACTHQKADGSGDTLTDNADGTVSCAICGYTFKPVEPREVTQETLQEAVNEVVDILQTIKLVWIDIDPAVGREFFQIIPLIEKIPALFDVAVKNYAKHEAIMPWGNNSRNMSTMQAFQMLSQLLNGGNAYANPQYQQPQGQPMYQQPVYGQPVQPQGAPVPPTNGFGYVGQGPMYQPQTNGFTTTYGQPVQPQPQQGAPQQSQAADASKTEETTVNKTFKA